MNKEKYYKIVYELKNKQNGSFIVIAKNQNEAIEKAKKINRLLFITNIFEYTKI